MKKTILKSLAGLFAILLMVSCSTEESSSVMPETNAAATTLSTARGGSFLNGIIGVLNADGTTTITADEALVKRNFEAELLEMGIDTQINYIAIEKRNAVNDPNDIAYIFLGSDGNGTSIGYMTTLAGGAGGVSNGGNFSLDDGDDSKPVSCRGCPTGCTLSYLIVQGHKFPYCNEGNCGIDCVKREK
jgi:hypothetical protein